MYNFVYDNINSCGTIEYYDIYRNNEPMYDILEETASLFINRSKKTIAFINAIELKDKSEINKMIELVIDMKDYLNITGYSIDESYKYLINKNLIEYLGVNIIW